MPFCCIAIVGVAIIYFIMLWIRQLFSWPRLDPNHPTTTATASGNRRYKPPPRALSGNGAWPVYGHTYLFMKLAGNTALEFPPHWRQVSFFPWTQQIGECFAIFFWGQWRVAIKGPKNAAKVMNGQRLKTDWPWTPPVALLGQSCLPILEEKDPQQADELRRLIETPLSHAAVLQFAPQFAECAAQCLHQIQQQQPQHHHHSGITTTPAKHLHSPGVSSDRSINLNTPSSSRAIPTGGGAASEDNDESTPSGSCYPAADYKVKWQALRSYTLDIMVGPLWNMSLHGQPAQTKKMAETTESTQQPHGQSTKEEDKMDLEDDVETSSSTAVVDPPKKKRVKKKDRPPRREHMLLWMERMKLGIDVIKTTFGPEWMYIWILNEYGRAINARMYVERHLSKHVKQQESMVPVSHKRGHATYETTTQMIPLLALKDNIVRSNEDIFGERRPRSWSRSDSFQPRPRAYSHPNVLLAQHHHHHATAEESSSSSGGGGGGGQSGGGGGSNQNCESLSSIFGTALGELDAAMCSDYITPFETEQDLARPRYEQSPFQSPDPMTKKQQKVGATSSTRAEGSSLSALKKQPLQPPAHPSESPSLRKGRKEMTAHHKQDVLRFAEPPGLVVTTDTDGKENKQQQYYAQEALQTPLPNKKKTKQQRTTPAPMPPIHHHHHINSVTTTPQPQQTEEPVTSLLENLLLQKGDNNKGISQTILTEISILLWMILDAGNAWTAMALHLLSNDRDACFLVQEEIDNLEERHGNHSLYTPLVLSKMKLLDALIFESIRLTPAFLGGLKSTTETVELDDAGVQIAKGSHVFFCQATDQKFDLQKAVGKRPEQLGKQYPTVELYGFLPLQGLEVPLMVLQCKVFLIAALRDFSPLVCRRRTFIRRVKNAVGDHLRSSFHGLTPSKDRTEGGDSSSCNNNNNEAVLIDGMDQMISDGTTVGGKQQESLASSTFDPEAGMTPGEVSQRDAMGFFTKIPFPEPKRVIRLRPRTID